MARRSQFFGALCALTLSASLALAGCSNNDTAETKPEAESTQSAPKEKTVTDLSGNELTIPADPQSIVVTDNRSFQILHQWGVKLSAAPRDLMYEPLLGDWKNDESIINIGNHKEPNMEAFVQAKPDLVINGQRFTKKADDIKALLPEGAAFVDTNRPEEMEMGEYFHTQVTLLGEIFDKQDEAKKLLEDFDKAQERAKKAYNAEQTVMGLVASGGNINYAAPGTGRSVGPLFPTLGLTPALEQDGSTNHMGDEVSLEAIAQANPEWFIVLDRDQSVASDEPGYSPAKDLIKGSEALQNVNAVKNDHIIVAPDGFYVAEDVLLYTDFLNSIADAFEAAK